MTAPVFESGSVAQALYTWSKTRIDATRGLGFVAVSPLLVESVDWLTKLKFPEFQLLEADADESLDSYESRHGFSETGRIIRGHVGILYRKTADGTVDASQRPQPVIHALFGNLKDMSLLCIDRIPPDRWIREVKNTPSGGLRLPGGGRLSLADGKLSDFCSFSWTSRQHECSKDHDNALQLLRVVADHGIDRVGSIDVSFDPAVLTDVSLAFPEDIVTNFSLTPYVTANNTRRKLTLQTPDLEAIDNDRGPRTASDMTGCQFQQSVIRAARAFLYVKEPSFQLYAKAILDPAGNAGHIALMNEATEKSPSREFESVFALIREIRTDTTAGRLSQRESLVLARRLQGLGFDMPKLLASPPELLETIFADVSGRQEILDWSRLLPGNHVNRFVELWNRTGFAVFLGIILLRSSDADKETVNVSAKTGAVEEHTRSVLRDTRHYQDGHLKVRRILHMGLGDSEEMRKFICKTFEDDPRFFYDAVLSEATVPRPHMLDYIKFNFNIWKAHRQLSSSEISVIREIFKPGLIGRLKMHLGIVSSSVED